MLVKVQQYLQAANTSAPGMADEIIEEAGEAFKQMLRQTFNEQRPDDFKLYFSNAGKPSCQLIMERDKAPREAKSYAFRMKMLLGEVTEILARAIMKGSGIKIESSQGRVKLPIGPIHLSGKYDDCIGGAIYDTKGSSNYTFQNKWKKGFVELSKDDPFGYVSQLYGYAEADKKKVGGWWVINRETGEWLLVEAPDSLEYRAKAVQKLEDNIVKVVDPSRPFKREFEDEVETFRKKPTGNRKLNFACSMCEFKWSCWPGLQVKREALSQADNPRMVYYTKLENTGEKSENEVS